MSPRLLLYGAGGHGKVVADAAEKAGCFELAGFVDDKPLTEFFGLPVLGDAEALSGVRHSGVEYAVSCVGDNEIREMLDETLLEAGFSFATVIHPSAQVARETVIGEGTVVMPGAIVGPGTVLGRSCVVNTSASIDHDCRLGNYVHVAPGASICGGVRIGSHSLVGVGASILPNIKIGPGAIVAGGATVTSDVPDDATVAGTPARAIQKGPLR